MEKFIPVAIFIAFIVGVGVIAQLLFGRRHRTHDGLPLPSQGGTMEDHTAGHEDYEGPRYVEVEFRNPQKIANWQAKPIE